MLALLVTLMLLLFQQRGAAPSKEASEEAVLWARILEVNLPHQTLQADWTQCKHSPLLEEDLHSSGKLWLRQPDGLRWETLSPVRRLTVLNGTEPRGRFRMPTEKDFRMSLVQKDQQIIVQLQPLRRDLKQALGRIEVEVNRESLLLETVTLTGTEGDWTRIQFQNVVRDAVLPDALFAKEN